MDFLSAFSGLERIAIIGGAMLVGFWGYRLFATDRTPALVFMGIACAVLLGALFTGESHVKNAGESYQLATASNTAGATPEAAVPAALPGITSLPQVTVEQPTSTATAEPSPDASIQKTEAAEAVATAGDDSAEPDTRESAPGSNPSEAPEVADLLSSQELGGRIVSVKSGSVSLEWAPRER